MHRLTARTLTMLPAPVHPMSQRVVVAAEAACVRITVEGAASMDDAARAITTAMADPAFDGQRPRLWDLRGSPMHLLGTGDAERMSEVVARLRADGAGEHKVAILVGGPLAFGLSRMLQSLNPEVMPDSMRICTDELEAFGHLGIEV